ncbi:hypothetical protein ACL02S_20370 [Nocardia sp. 004]|uniref:hypothetical protein n=1 Tax=Nocardia sp. 004 TaxID=3385978 RepID=UPI0039A343D8
MFIQVIQGKVAAPARLRQRMNQWDQKLQHGAFGYLGTTSGMCDDGTIISLTRFESEQSERLNSKRPEQAAWWAATEKCFDGPLTVMDCTTVTEWMGGSWYKAGFVQIIEGHTRDAVRMRELLMQTGERVHELRPEILSGTLAIYGDDGFVEAVYFTSEAEARAHERAKVPDDLRALFEEESRLMGEVTYFDLRKPTLLSPGRK